jgi:hypothetical protein
MTEVQIWSIAVAALVAAILVTAVALRRRRKRAHPHGHLEVDMTVPRTGSVTVEPIEELTKDRATGGGDIKEL